MKNISTREFALPLSGELRTHLEHKRREYADRIQTPDEMWRSWRECDLSARHHQNPDFRLLYYKYVILSSVLLMDERFKKIHQVGTNHLPDTVTSRYLAYELSANLGSPLDMDQFDQAAHVIENYLIGIEPLP